MDEEKYMEYFLRFFSFLFVEKKRNHNNINNLEHVVDVLKRATNEGKRGACDAMR